MSNKRTGNYDNYARLLNKYKIRQPQEKRSVEYYKEESKNARLNDFLHMSEHIMDKMKLVGTQRRDLKWIIKNVPFNELNRKARAEIIIICLCIYIRRSYGDNFRWQAYSIVQKYGVSCTTILTVVTNLCIWYSRCGIMPRIENVNKHGTLIADEEDDTEDYLKKSDVYPKYVYRKILK